MDKMVLYPILIMFILAIFNQAYQYSNTDLSLTSTPTIDNSTGTVITDGTSTEITIPTSADTYTLNMTMGFIGLTIGIVALGVVLGITALGSGISQRAQRIVFVSAICWGAWGLFSALTYTIFTSIPTLGSVLWLAFTFVFTFGFFKEANGAGA